MSEAELRAIDEEARIRGISREEFLRRGLAAGLAVAGSGALARTAGAAMSAAPKRGGTFRVRVSAAPAHFDFHQTASVSTMIPLSFAYSRLMKVKAGIWTVPGTQPRRGRPSGLPGRRPAQVRSRSAWASAGT